MMHSRSIPKATTPAAKKSTKLSHSKVLEKAFVSKPKSDWNGYMTDINQFKLTKEEILKKKSLLVSRNNIFTAAEATKEKIYRQKTSHQESLSSSSRPQGVQRRARSESRGRSRGNSDPTNSRSEQDATLTTRHRSPSTSRSVCASERKESPSIRMPDHRGRQPTAHRSAQRRSPSIDIGQDRSLEIADLTALDILEVSQNECRTQRGAGGLEDSEKELQRIRRQAEMSLKQHVERENSSSKPRSSRVLDGVRSVEAPLASPRSDRSRPFSSPERGRATRHQAAASSPETPVSSRGIGWGIADSSARTPGGDDHVDQQLAREAVMQIRLLYSDLVAFESSTGKECHFDAESVEEALQRANHHSSTREQGALVPLVLDMWCQSLTYLLETAVDLNKQRAQVKQLTEKINILQRANSGAGILGEFPSMMEPYTKPGFLDLKPGQSSAPLAVHRQAPLASPSAMKELFIGGPGPDYLAQPFPKSNSGQFFTPNGLVAASSPDTEPYGAARPFPLSAEGSDYSRYDRSPDHFQPTAGRTDAVDHSHLYSIQDTPLKKFSSSDHALRSSNRYSSAADISATSTYSTPSSNYASDTPRSPVDVAPPKLTSSLSPPRSSRTFVSSFNLTPARTPHSHLQTSSSAAQQSSVWKEIPVAGSMTEPLDAVDTSPGLQDDWLFAHAMKMAGDEQCGAIRTPHSSDGCVRATQGGLLESSPIRRDRTVPVRSMSPPLREAGPLEQRDALLPPPPLHFSKTAVQTPVRHAEQAQMMTTPASGSYLRPHFTETPVIRNPESRAAGGLGQRPVPLRDAEADFRPSSRLTDPTGTPVAHTNMSEHQTVSRQRGHSNGSYGYRAVSPNELSHAFVDASDCFQQTTSILQASVSESHRVEEEGEEESDGEEPISYSALPSPLLPPRPYCNDTAHPFSPTKLMFDARLGSF